MEFENVGEEYKEKIKSLFPSINKETDETPIIVFSDILNSFSISCKENEYIKYLSDRPEEIDLALYLSQIPNGVESFEKWVNTGFYGLAEDILINLKALIPPSVGFIYLAQFFDDHNYDNYFKNAKIPPELHGEIKSSFEIMFSEPGLTLFSQAIGCASIGLFNSSISLMTLVIQKLICENEDIYKTISNAKKIETENKKATKDSLTSNSIKHNKNRVIKDYTIRKFIALPAHSYKTIKEAIDLIIEDVINYSNNSEDMNNVTGYFEFDNGDKDRERPKANIRNWISDYKKSLKTSN